MVDLDDQSFILFNYTMEDMKNPTIVKNSFSQSITLKGTPNNNKIFGGIWRSDRETVAGGASGVNFDPTIKTPFVIYNELNEILESGYCKLDNISRSKSSIEYKVSLYGGLGAFFYALSYDEQGNKRTLADLKFTGEKANDTELNFAINKDSVINSWKRLNGDSSQSSLWDIINFAPAYNGLPTGTFDADKAIIDTNRAGLPIPSGYYADSKVLCSLPKKYTEWDVHDLRSYLQRPVVKMSKIIEAICKSYNNGGYSVDLDSAFFSSTNPYYSKTWLTLPIINTLKIETSEVTGNITPYADGRTIYLSNGGQVASLYKVNLSFLPLAELSGSSRTNLYLTNESWDENDDYVYYNNEISYTVCAYDKDGILLQRKMVILTDDNGYFSSNGVWQGDRVSFSLEAYGINSITLTQEVNGYASNGNPMPFALWSSKDTPVTPVQVSSYLIDYQYGDNTYSFVTSESARTGATITKKNLLSSDKTPADYLLSFCKIFGLVFKYDRESKKVSIMPKKSFYNGTVVDLTKRVNIGKGISISPFSFDSKWYDLMFSSSKGEFLEYYKGVYGREYGLQRINTGYAFNADSKNLMEGNVFKVAAEVMENSKYFVDIKLDSKYYPSVMQDIGGTYSLTSTSGDKSEFDIPSIPSKATRTWWNSSYNTYDIISKLQFHEGENKPFDERDTLVFFSGMKNISGITQRLCVTDDNYTMLNLNGNTPCWILDDQLDNPNYKVTNLPMFSRYLRESDKSLDFGIPAEVAIPDVAYGERASVYSQYWSKYINDRYDNDSKVMTCKVNLSGMQVDESLFQSFYYYDGALWALNKIINHSLTTWDDTECEFVKVQDKSNYLN